MNIRIKELREDKDLLQKNIAMLLGITQQQYSRIEKGINELSYDGLDKLADFYNVSVDYLLGRTDIMKPYPLVSSRRSQRTS